jgi:hypothetical protein
LPAPILKLLAFGIKSLTHYFVYPTKTIVDKAMHLCPDAPKAALTKAFKASYLSASGIIIP